MGNKTFTLSFSCPPCRHARKIMIEAFVPVKRTKESEEIISFLARCVDSNADGTNNPQRKNYGLELAPRLVEDMNTNGIGQILLNAHYERFHHGLPVPDVVNISN